MWATLGKLLLSGALWCLHNPDKVDAGIKDVHVLVDALHAAKKPAS